MTNAKTKIERLRDSYSKGLTAKEAYKRHKGKIALAYISTVFSDIKANRVKG